MRMERRLYPINTGTAKDACEACGKRPHFTVEVERKEESYEGEDLSEVIVQFDICTDCLVEGAVLHVKDEPLVPDDFGGQPVTRAQRDAWRTEPDAFLDMEMESRIGGGDVEVAE